MPLTHLYQEFGLKPNGASDGVEINDLELEEQKLEAFENGYQAGWDDAVNAQVTSHTRISSDFEKNLQEMSFSFHEARASLTKSLQPLFSDIVDTLLPSIARKSIGGHVVTQLTEMSKKQLDQSIEITVSPSSIEAIEMLVENTIQEPFIIVGDANLGEGQVYLRVGSEERKIDLDEVVEAVGAALTTFFNSQEQDKSHG